MSVYKYLEAFAKLEKRLSEGQEGSAATRGQPTIHDVRGKLDKFIKALGPSEIQVRVFMRVVYQHFVHHTKHVQQLSAFKSSFYISPVCACLCQITK